MSDFGDERLFNIDIMDFNSTYTILLASVNRFQLKFPSLKVPDYLFKVPTFPWKLFVSIIVLAVSALGSLVGIMIYAEKPNPHRPMEQLKKVSDQYYFRIHVHLVIQITPLNKDFTMWVAI
jgi:hypothetical protein